jgi:hypothetical protein
MEEGDKILLRLMRERFNYSAEGLPRTSSHLAREMFGRLFSSLAGRTLGHGLEEFRHQVGVGLELVNLKDQKNSCHEKKKKFVR